MRVEVKQGKLEGTRAISELTGEEYIGFYGIPYAKPPVGDLRFRVSTSRKNFGNLQKKKMLEIWGPH